MATTKSSTLYMVFNLSGEGGKTHTISLADPIDGITLASVSAVADKVIDDDLLDVGGKTAKNLKEAYVRDVEITSLE